MNLKTAVIAAISMAAIACVLLRRFIAITW